MRNSTMPMMASQNRPLIVKPMTTRAIQTESDPEHEGEEQESEHGGLPRVWEAPPTAASVTRKQPVTRAWREYPGFAELNALSRAPHCHAQGAGPQITL